MNKKTKKEQEKQKRCAEFWKEQSRKCSFNRTIWVEYDPTNCDPERFDAERIVQQYAYVREAEIKLDYPDAKDPLVLALRIITDSGLDHSSLRLGARSTAALMELTNSKKAQDLVGKVVSILSVANHGCGDIVGIGVNTCLTEDHHGYKERFQARMEQYPEQYRKLRKEGGEIPWFKLLPDVQYPGEKK